MWRKIWEHWKRIAKKIGDFNARLLMTLFYFLLILPLSLPVRLIDPLAIRKKRKAGWIPKQVQEGSEMERALRQS